LAGGHLSALEKEKFYNDASIKHMMRTMSFQEALTATSKKFLTVKKKVEKIDDKVFKRARKDFVRNNYGTRGLTGGSLTGKAAILMADDEITGMEGRLENLKKGRKKDIGRKGALSRRLNRNDLTKAQERNTKAKLDLVDARLSAFSEAIERVTDDIAIAGEGRDSLISGSRKRGFIVSGASGSRSFQDLTPHEKFMQKVEKIKLVFISKLRSVQAGIRMFFNKGNMKMLGNAIKMGASFLGKALLAITILGLVVFALHKMNFFAETKEAFKKFAILQKMFEVVSGSFGLVFEGLPQVLGGIWGVISGLFGGDGKKVLESLKKLGNGLLNVALGLLGIAIMGSITILATLLTGLLSIIMGTIISTGKTVVKAVRNLADGTKGSVKSGLTGAAIGGALVTGGVALSATGVGTPLGLALIGGGILAGGAIGAANPMASGGTNLLGGNYLVGDNGPEIISLPGGSSITNNTNTRSAMGTTINVHVNGRVGASDQELNQLADKIGQKISMRMNRFSPTGMRG